MSLLNTFNDIMKLEEVDRWIGLNFINEEDLDIVIDNMNELELREKVADELGDHVAYTASLKQLIDWYSNKLLHSK